MELLIGGFRLYRGLSFLTFPIETDASVHLQLIYVKPACFCKCELSKSILYLLFQCLLLLDDDMKLLLMEMSKLEGIGAFALRYLYMRAWCSSSIHCEGVKGILVLDNKNLCSFGLPKPIPNKAI